MNEVEWKEFVEKHLLKCGTCVFRRKGKCHNFHSESFNEIVDDDCSCERYVISIQNEIYLVQ